MDRRWSRLPPTFQASKHVQPERSMTRGFIACQSEDCRGRIAAHALGPIGLAGGAIATGQAGQAFFCLGSK